MGQYKDFSFYSVYDWKITGEGEVLIREVATFVLKGSSGYYVVIRLLGRKTIMQSRDDGAWTEVE